MPSEKHLARKISLISTSVFALFLVCLVIFTRFFLIQKEQAILENIDTTPIQTMEFGENFIRGQDSISSNISMIATGGIIAQEGLTPIIDISEGTMLPVMEIQGNSRSPMMGGSISVSADAGLIFESLRDSIVIQGGKEPIKNGLFYRHRDSGLHMKTGILLSENMRENIFISNHY